MGTSGQPGRGLLGHAVAWAALALASGGLAPSGAAQAPCAALLGADLRAQTQELDAIMRAQLGRFPPEREGALGQALLAELAAGPTPLDQDPTEQASLQRVLDRVQSVHQRRRFHHRVHLVEDEAQNASALPGGQLLVHRGLLRHKIHSEAMLAFVLGHELSHVELGHSAAVYQYLATLPLLRQDLPGELLVLARHTFSALHELEADRLGAVLASLAGYAATEGVRFWAQDWPPPRSAIPPLWEPQARALPAPLRAQVEEVLSGHPPTAARSCAVLEGEALVRARTGTAGDEVHPQGWPRP